MIFSWNKCQIRVHIILEQNFLLEFKVRLKEKYKNTKKDIYPFKVLTGAQKFEGREQYTRQAKKQKEAPELTFSKVVSPMPVLYSSCTMAVKNILPSPEQLFITFKRKKWRPSMKNSSIIVAINWFQRQIIFSFPIMTDYISICPAKLTDRRNEQELSSYCFLIILSYLK